MTTESTATIRVRVGNAMGLHARPAAQLVHIAGKFKSLLHLHKADGSGEADCRSVLSMLMLAAGRGTELDVVADGEDSAEALKAISAYFNSNFGEE